MNKDNTKEEHKTKFWIYDPYVLLDKSKVFDLWPLESMTREEKLNAISKFVIYATILGVFLFRNLKLFLKLIIQILVQKIQL